MKDLIAVHVAFCLLAAVLGLTAVLDSWIETARGPAGVENTLERACIPTCPDGPPFCERVPGAYFPPRP